MPQDTLMNIKEVAEYLKISEDMVKGLVSRGEMPAYKIGGLLLRFKREQVEQYRNRAASGHADPPAVKQKSGTARRVLKKQGEGVSYSLTEKLEDFLYYNDFYILSLILLAVVMFAIFEL